MSNDWIEWSGGECPVPAGTRVEVRFRNRVIVRLTGERVTEYGWTHIGSLCDIVAYRVVKPAAPPAPDTAALNALWQDYAKHALQGLLACDAAIATRPGFAECAADAAEAMLAETVKRGRV